MSSVRVRKSQLLKDGGWTAIPNLFLRSGRTGNTTCSTDARWLWVYLFSHSDDFNLTMTQLQRDAQWGRDKARKVVAELEAAGLLVKTRLVGDDGRYANWAFDVQLPLTENQSLALTREKADNRRSGPVTENPATDNPAPENQADYKKNTSKKITSKKNNPTTSQLQLEPEPEYASGGAELALVESPGGLRLVHSEPVEVGAHTVVATWIDAIRANGVEPSKAQINRVARSAKELLVRNDGSRVLDAARHAGEHGNAAIDSALTILAGKPFESRRRQDTKLDRVMDFMNPRREGTDVSWQ